MPQPQSSNKIYFDCNASTSVIPQAIQASLEVMQNLYGNPSSGHSAGIQAKAVLESARKCASDFLGAEDSNQIIFTSGATEAIQLAVFSALSHLKRPLILVGATEHKAVPEAIHHWAAELEIPHQILTIPVDSRGLYDLDFLRKQLLSNWQSP